MIEPRILHRIRNGVCAVGYLTVPLPDPATGSRNEPSRQKALAVPIVSRALAGLGVESGAVQELGAVTADLAAANAAFRQLPSPRVVYCGTVHSGSATTHPIMVVEAVVMCSLRLGMLRKTAHIQEPAKSFNSN